MFKKTSWLAGLLTAVGVTVLTAGEAAAQGEAVYAPPAVDIATPLNDRLPDGGLFLAGEYVMFRQTTPLQPQLVVVRGFTNTDSSGVLGLNVGQFVGSRAPTLDVSEVEEEQYAPGYKFDLGYRFQDGSVVSVSTWRLFNATVTNGATFAAPNFAEGPQLQNGFLSAPVFNFPQEFSGPPKIFNAAGNAVPGAAVGIWNGASETGEKFYTRTEEWDVTYRFAPYYETEDCRISGWVVPVCAYSR